MTEPQNSRATEDIIADFSSGNWLVRREAVHHATAALKAAGDAGFHSKMAGHLAKLASDEKWEVRSAVAQALQYLRSPIIDKTLAHLLDDAHFDVRRSAEQTLRKKRQATPPGEWGEESSLAIREHEAYLRRTFPRPVAVRALQISQKRLELFARVSAHELKAILTPLKSRISKAKHAIAEGRKAKAAIQHLEKAQERCDYIDRMLDYMKDWTAEVRSEIHKENVRGMLEEAWNLVREKFEAIKPSVKVNGTIDADPKLHIDAPRARLIQAFRNVIQNSFEAIEPAGVGNVRISATTEKDKLIIAFEDDGCGMSEETRKDALLPFTSTKNSTGFGLPIAYKIVHNECRGELDLPPRAGQWTRVLLTLPLEFGPGEADS